MQSRAKIQKHVAQQPCAKAHVPLGEYPHCMCTASTFGLILGPMVSPWKPWKWCPLEVCGESQANLSECGGSRVLLFIPTRGLLLIFGGLLFRLEACCQCLEAVCRSQSAPHMHLLVCICSNIRQSHDLWPGPHNCYGTIIAQCTRSSLCYNLCPVVFSLTAGPCFVNRGGAFMEQYRKAHS